MLMTSVLEQKGEPMAEYIVKETSYSLGTRQEVIGELIRCKDCKHQVKEWRTDKRLKGNGYMVCGCDVVGDACGYWALLGQDDDYCSYAERRADDRIQGI